MRSRCIGLLISLVEEGGISDGNEIKVRDARMQIWLWAIIRMCVVTLVSRDCH